MEDTWICRHCDRWGFIGDAIGRECEHCGDELCDQCHSGHIEWCRDECEHCREACDCDSAECDECSCDTVAAR